MRSVLRSSASLEDTLTMDRFNTLSDAELVSRAESDPVFRDGIAHEVLLRLALRCSHGALSQDIETHNRQEERATGSKLRHITR